MKEKLTHMDQNGRPRMVDVSDKEDTKRLAIAKASIFMKPETLERIREGAIAKGDVLSVAQTAGIMAAKNTASMIPMCHNIFISGVEMDFEMDSENSAVHITASASTQGKTGIEMESLCAVSVAALTIYDMCKAIDRGMTISEIKLVYKEGGKSGVYKREDE
jgi:cyclic pyranopterin phosphate synthase